jgi:uncharacterized protein
MTIWRAVVFSCLGSVLCATAQLTPNELTDIQKRAASGDASAEYQLGRAYETGQGAPQNTMAAAKWYRKAAEQGNAQAQNSLGVLYWMGDGVDGDKNLAVEWYRKAARQGNANAMFNLGAAYYNAEGVNLDDTLALSWFLLSAAAGNSSGQEAANRSEREHGLWLFNDACVAIGEMYERGEDLPKNADFAAIWYRKAASRGDHNAELKLAILALNSGNYSEAKTRCESAAKASLDGGYACLGYLYQHGLGVRQNGHEAIKHYQQAALWHNRDALHALAQLYAEGNGKKEDRQKLFFSLVDAALRGDRQSASDAQKLQSIMTDDEWKDTQKKWARAGLDPKRLEAVLQLTVAH